MTKEEFETAYAEASGLNVLELDILGLRALPCDCGDAICRGWQMVSEGCDEPAV